MYRWTTTSVGWEPNEAGTASGPTGHDQSDVEAADTLEPSAKGFVVN